MLGPDSMQVDSPSSIAPPGTPTLAGSPNRVAAPQKRKVSTQARLREQIGNASGLHPDASQERAEK